MRKHSAVHGHAQLSGSIAAGEASRRGTVVSNGWRALRARVPAVCELCDPLTWAASGFVDFAASPVATPAGYLGLARERPAATCLSHSGLGLGSGCLPQANEFFISARTCVE